MACIVFSLEDGTTFTSALDTELLTIGRHPDSMAQLLSPSVSSHHAAIQLREDGFYVNDLGSRNGTRVNGAEIEEAKLNDGDRVAFGDVQSVYYAADQAPEEDEVAAVAEQEPAPLSQPPVQKLVSTPSPVSGIPPGAGVYAPRVRPTPSAARKPAEEGGGCMTAFVLTLLFLLAFVLGLSLRHYQQTNGGFLPSDLAEKLFSKASKIHIETGDEK